MLYPIKVVDLELSHPLVTIEGLEAYKSVQGLVRLHGEPIGHITAPITNNFCAATTLKELILSELSEAILNCLLRRGLSPLPHQERLNLEALFQTPPPSFLGEYLSVTVAVCTRDRAEDLDRCLSALKELAYPNLDLLVVDNAPTSSDTQDLVTTKYPEVRYCCEPRPGLNWARNRAILEAQGDILAYTDDDAIVDPGWVKALVAVFAENPEVMAVTGLVVPYELETEAQVLFEYRGGFGKGFDSRWFYRYPDSRMSWQLLGTGQYGTGANMAFRRCVLEKIGYFDPALDVGTVTNGGGDLEMYFRLVKEGYTLVYEPKAMVRHCHRRTYEKLRSQLANNSIGLFSYCIRSFKAYPDERLSFLILMVWWIVAWNLRRLWVAFKIPMAFPKDLVLAELWGCLQGLNRYSQARKNALKILEEYGEPSDEKAIAAQVLNPSPSKSEKPAISRTTAVRSIDFKEGLQPIAALEEYSDVKIVVQWDGRPLGDVDIANVYQSLQPQRLRAAMVKALGLKLIDPELQSNASNRQSVALGTLNQCIQIAPTDPQKSCAAVSAFAQDALVSINLATFDRPDDLRNCLKSLLAQKTQHPVEIIVVDNHPASGLTPPVVAEFATVKLVSEPRQGLAYARNAGFVHSRGEVVIATDDDVTLPPDWIEKLVAPFARADVAIVTGNVLPIQLETIDQRFFERYGGLGRGYEPFERDRAWFESFPRDAVPTWTLGATANAAFRASIFSDPRIGLMDEALGPGMPSGVGEDTYLFYKVLRAGYTVAYEPGAYVWHKHRRDRAALKRQIYGYSKGHISYNLTTWLKDGDWRGLWHSYVVIPFYHLKRIAIWLKGQSNYPLSLILLEIRGNLIAPWALWRSRQRVKREGFSEPYIPVEQRSPLIEKTETEKATV
jgi:GT2 family glycosyltransferase